MEEHAQQDLLRGALRKLYLVGVAVAGKNLALVMAQTELRKATTQMLAPLRPADIQAIARQYELQGCQQRVALVLA